MTATEQVILVDNEDHPQGVCEKIQAHRDNLCHRAFSVFIFRKRDEVELLLQQRAQHKYHSPLLWTNTCCSHPRPGEEVIAAGQRRLTEEMGLVISLCSLGFFHYIAHFDNGLTENEVDHVLIGDWNEEPIYPNCEEVEAYRWMSVSMLKEELIQHKEQYTPWLDQALQVIQERGLVF